MVNHSNNNKTIKLHLGCGNVNIPGYVNIDSRKTKSTDLVQDIRNIKKFKKYSIDEIYVCHVLEHFGRFEVYEILKKWRKLLKKNGKLKIAVPDFNTICEIYLKSKKIQLIEGPVIGGQNYKLNFHYNIFDFKKLKKILEECGFYSIKKYDWRKTEHSHIDDYSQAYIPHMKKETGTLISLNIECLRK